MSGGHWPCQDAPDLQGLPSLIPVDKRRRSSSVEFTSIFKMYYNSPFEAFYLNATYCVFTEVLVGAYYAFLFGPFRHDFRVRNHNAHQTGLERTNINISQTK